MQKYTTKLTYKNGLPQNIAIRPIAHVAQKNKNMFALIINLNFKKNEKITYFLPSYCNYFCL